MPTPWNASSVARLVGGGLYYQVIISTPEHGKKDVTYLRNVPTQITSYTSADPFGDSTAQITFPQISIFDDVGNGELKFLRDYADVTINLLNPTTSYVTLNGQSLTVVQTITTTAWEGYISSFEWHQDSTSSSLTVQCQGACFQVDQSLAKPQFPARPIPYETLIKEVFSHKRNPALRTKPLKIEFPAGWDIVAPNYGNTPSYLTPVGVTPGQSITGYFSRSTGSWDKALTSFVQSLLNVMFDNNGQQWSIRLDPGRQPVLYVRQMLNPTPVYTVSAGQQGVAIDLSRDLTQYANVLYGQGTDAAGVEWDRQEVSNDGHETAYAPLSFDPEVYPTIHNKRLNTSKPVVEAFTKFDNGFDERQALRAARVMLSRDMDPGLQGTLTLTVDPQTAFMGLIKAGQPIKVQHLLGMGSAGIVFNVAQADHDPMNRTCTLKIDTKFRDLLTLEEVMVRTRDPLTPVQMLKINSQQLLIQDAAAPWNYKKGSGFIPKRIDFFKDIPAAEQFPYKNHSLAYPPKKYPHMYVTVNANAKSRNKRWKVVPIRMSEAGSIRLIQIAAYDEKGNIIKIPFHFSLYYKHITVDDMPYDNNGHSPFIDGAFDSTNALGEIIPAGTSGATTLPADSLIIGWGNKLQPAGYSPGMKSAGDHATGLLIDEQSWDYTVIGNNKDWITNVSSGQREPESAITVYGIFYAEYSDYVHFRGRMYRSEPGTS